MVFISFDTFFVILLNLNCFMLASIYFFLFFFDLCTAAPAIVAPVAVKKPVAIAPLLAPLEAEDEVVAISVDGSVEITVLGCVVVIWWIVVTVDGSVVWISVVVA